MRNAKQLVEDAIHFAVNKKAVFLSFNGWSVDPSEVVAEFEKLGYKIQIGCMTYRHHARVTAYLD